MSRFVVQSVVHAGVFALAVSAVAVVAMVPLEAQKGKPQPTNPPASVLFTDTPGEAITSDATPESGPRPYVNGQDGVEATLFTASGDLVLQLGNTRRINVLLPTGMQLASDDAAPGAPTGPIVSAGTFYVDAVSLIPEGETRARIVRLGNFTTLPNQPIAFRQLTQAGTLINGTPVCVTRDSVLQWRIRTSSDGTCGQDVLPAGEPTPGEVAGMWSETTVKGKTKQTFVARYRLPFSATVTCLRTNCQ